MRGRSARAAASFLVCSLVAALASPARSAEEPFVPGSARKALEDAVRAGETGKAAAYLESLVAPGAERDRRRHVEAARGAMALLPPETAAPHCVRLLAEALHMDRSDADGAWTLAQELRKELLGRVDVGNGERFLEKLVEIYPDVPSYRYDLGVLLLDGGRREDARAVFELLHRNSPSDPKPAYRLADLAEDDGDPRRAVSYYDAILAARPQELYAHQYKAALLSGSLGDHPAALRAVEDGVRAAEGLAAGAQREEFLRRFAEERTRVEDAVARRHALGELSSRIDRILLGALAAWAVAAVAAVLWLRRLESRPTEPAVRET